MRSPALSPLRMRTAHGRSGRRSPRGSGGSWRAARGAGRAYLVVLHEVHEGRALDLHRLPLPVVERQDEVEEVGFPQVGRRLLLKVGPGQGDSAARGETRGTAGAGRRERHGVTSAPTQHRRGARDPSWVESSGPLRLFFFSNRIKKARLFRGVAVAGGLGWQDWHSRPLPPLPAGIPAPGLWRSPNDPSCSPRPERSPRQGGAQILS